MADKVIDIDPSKRLSKEALNTIKTEINFLEADDLDTLIVIYTPKKKLTNVMAYGVDFFTLGMAQSMLAALGQQLLKEQFETRELK